MMEVHKREIKIKRHKDLTTKMILKNKNNNKRQREFSGAGVGVSKFFLPEKRKLINVIHSCSRILINSSYFQQQQKMQVLVATVRSSCSEETFVIHSI
mgnify:FL=1